MGEFGEDIGPEKGQGALPKGKTATGSSRTEARGATKKKGRGPKHIKLCTRYEP